MGQFMKGQSYSELKAPNLIKGFEMEQFGDPEFFRGEPAAKDFENAERGLLRMREILTSGKYDLVILDEINTTLHFQLLNVEKVLSLMDLKPDGVELILTGRYAPQEIMDRADLVTEMKEIKHYYNQGVPARTGIEN
jgi:cob(I)alamin adenosyltransferase